MPDSNELNERTYRLRTEEVQQLIKDRGLTPARLAAKMEVTTRRLNQWLKGERLFVKNIVALAEYLGVKAQDIIDGFQPRQSNLGLSVSMKIECATSDEFIYLCELLGEVKLKLEAFRSFQAHIDEPKITICFLESRNKAGDFLYGFCMVSSKLWGDFLQSLDEGVVPDYSIVFEMGLGWPTQEVFERVKNDYGFDYLGRLTEQGINLEDYANARRLKAKD